MPENVIDIRNRLRGERPRRVIPQQPTPQPVQPPPAFAIENTESGRTVITTPLSPEAAHAIHAQDFTLPLSGRLVEAERANRNGAFWSQGDLEFGLPSVAYGPLNWLHEERKIVGTLLNPRMVRSDDREASAAGLGPHIRTDAVMWKWLYPREAAMVSEYAAGGRAWLSMECISQQVQCVGPGGCGQTVPYMDYQAKNERSCAHLNERAAHRRFVNPIFQGAAVIVPPTQPGWANADLGLTVSVESERQAASLLERDVLTVPGVTEEIAHDILAQILQWSAREV